MNFSQKREMLYQLVKESKFIRAVGAYDAISAQLIEESDFEAVWAGGMGICTALGYPDTDIVTMSEFLEYANVINRSTQLPVIADCNCGFGGVNNVIRMVREYENAGIAALCIEDQAFPKRNSFYSGTHRLEDINQFCEKITVATQTREDPKMLIIARIEALVAGQSVEEALNRAHLYKQAGADIIAIHSKKNNPEEVIQFLKFWAAEGPVMLIPTTYHLSVEQLKELNIAIAVYANQILRAFVPCMKQLLTQITDDSSTVNIKFTGLAELDEIFHYHNLSAAKRFSINYKPKK